MENKKRKSKSDADYLPIPGFLLIGLGIGLFTGQVAPFLLIGLGLGFLISFILLKKK